MSSLSKAKRLERLERLSQPGEGNPFLSMSDPEFMSHLESVLELEAGALPRSPEESAARGFLSMAEALASVLGVSYEELKRFIFQGS